METTPVTVQCRCHMDEQKKLCKNTHPAFIFVTLAWEKLSKNLAVSVFFCSPGIFCCSDKSTIHCSHQKPTELNIGWSFAINFSHFQAAMVMEL